MVNSASYNYSFQANNSAHNIWKRFDFTVSEIYSSGYWYSTMIWYSYYYQTIVHYHLNNSSKGS